MLTKFWKAPTIILAFMSLVFAPGLKTEAFGQDSTQDYLDGARQFLQAARTASDSAQQACGEIDCSFDLIAQFSAIGQAMDRLAAQLADPTDLTAIQSFVDATAQIGQTICDLLGGQCTGFPGGAAGPNRTFDNIPGEEGYEYRMCLRSVVLARGRCVQEANRILNCWQRVPFCDESGWPLDAGGFRRDCADLIATQVLPACRCQCPQSERQGGCPPFFETGALSCSDCSHQSCQRGGNARCSCRQEGPNPSAWSSVQCDLCKWSNIGVALADLRRKQCEKRYVDGVRSCRE